MTKILLAAMLLLVAMPAVADEAPAWLGAADLDLAKFEGQVVLVDSWASWCKPCKESMPWLSAMQEKYGAQGLQVVAVSIDKKLDSALGMNELMHKDFVRVHDPQGKLAEAYELEAMPSSYLYNRQGELVAGHVGFLVSECEAKEAELLELLAGAKTEDSDEAQ